MKKSLTPEQAAEDLIKKVRKQDKTRNFNMKPFCPTEVEHLIRWAFSEGIEYAKKNNTKWQQQRLR